MIGVPSRMLLTTDAVGGVWGYTLALADGLARRGCRCTVAVLGPPPDAAQRRAVAAHALVETGLPLDWLAEDAGELSASAAELVGVAEAAGCRAMHLHTPALAYAPWPMPPVAVAHSCVATWWEAMRGGEPPSDFAWRRDAMARGIEAAAAVIAPSAAFAAALRRVYRCDAAVVHNGLPWTEVPDAARERSVLAAGRLWDEGKGMRLLDAAAALLDVPVRVAGPLRGDNGESLEPRHLLPLGVLDPASLRAACARAGVFAAPSRYEPFGLAVLEAAQLATPLVLADIPTFRELWDGAALFVPERTPQAWAKTLRELLDDAGLRAGLGLRAQRRARRYSVDAMVDATLAVHAANYVTG